jgi:predicted outer membrane protein
MTSAIPTALDDSSQKKLDMLRNAKPEDFASDYDPMQVSAHKDAVSLFERYAKGGDNAKLKDWAGKTLPVLQTPSADGRTDGSEPQEGLSCESAEGPEFRQQPFRKKKSRPV